MNAKALRHGCVCRSALSPTPRTRNESEHINAMMVSSYQILKEGG